MKETDEFFEESEQAKALLHEFCKKVRDLGPHLTGMCGIDSPHWDASLSEGYGIDDYEAVNELMANFLDALSIRFAWGPDELFEFLEKAVRKVALSMRSRPPAVDRSLPPS